MARRRKRFEHYRYMTHAQRMAVRTSRQWLAGYPHLVAQWHPTKNGELYPYEVSRGSDRFVWWKCPKGPDHEWRSRAGNRTSGLGCAFCHGALVSVTNSLATCKPALAAEWHPTKNGRLTPRAVTTRSGRKVWWRCARGHDWRAVIANRFHGTGCPRCPRRVPAKKSLARRFPALVAEWHPTKNGELTPEDVSYGSNAKIWWRCLKVSAHEWRTVASQRTSGRSGCPFCSGSRVSERNSLARRFPALLAEWHPTKNGKLDPDGVSYSSKIKIWWRCLKVPAHVWCTDPNQRTSGRSKGCPYCSGVRVHPTTCLATKFPKIAKEWHPTKNGEATPRSILATSHFRAWWQCAQVPAHTWSSVVRNRTRNGTGCPYCYKLAREAGAPFRRGHAMK